MTFSFYPVYGDIENTSQNGSYRLNLHYLADSEDLASIRINVYDANGNLVTALSPVEVTPPTDEVELDFAAKGLPSGEYTVEVVGIDAEGKELSVPYTINLTYNEDKKEAPEDASVPAPDTGRFFGIGNVSGSDLIVTSLAVFVAAATVAIALIIRTKKDKSGQKK